MPTPTLIVGAPCWIDLYSSDTPSATAFYRRLLGWSPSRRARTSAATSRSPRTASMAGCMANDGTAGYPDGWGVHLRTDDIEATAKATTDHGGKVEKGR